MSDSQLLGVDEIGRFEVTLRQRPLWDSKVSVDTPLRAADVARKTIPQDGQEHMLVMLLDTRSYLIGTRVISTGSLSCSIVHPREVFRAAILAASSSILLAHNHPSGQTDPSPEDNRVTLRVREAGEIIGIQLNDHVIVSHESKDHYSYRREGWMT